MCLAYGCIKLSIVFFYRRMLVTHSTSLFSIITWILIAINILWSVAFVFVFVFACGTHFSANWTTLAALLEYCSTGLPQEEACYVSEFIINGLLLIAPLPSVRNILII